MRKWIAIASLALALAAGELLAKKGGNPGGGGEEPAADPAIAYELGDDLYVMNADGSNATRVLSAGSAGGIIRDPSWSPDGSQLAFMVRDTAGSGLCTLDIDVVDGAVTGSNLTELTEVAYNRSGSVAWSPVAINGVERIAFYDYDASYSDYDRLFLINADGSGGRIYLDRAASHGSSGISWSPSGDRLAVARGEPGLRVHDLDVDSNGNVYVSDSHRYTVGTKVYNVDWSNTQADVLVIAVTNPSYEDLWLIDLDDAVATSDPVVFTLNTHVSLTSTTRIEDHHATWSPDDSQILWRQAGRGATNGIHVLRVDGTEDPELLLGDKKTKPYRPDWRR